MVTKASKSLYSLLFGLGMTMMGSTNAAYPTPVNDQITDSVTQANIKTVAAEPLSEEQSGEEKRGQAYDKARDKTRLLNPMQPQYPPGWQAKPPGWQTTPPGWEAAERARIQFIQQQQQIIQQQAQQFGSVYQHWSRHAPTWAQPFYPPGSVPQQVPPVPAHHE